jgi:DNA-binding transcriptional LysR family regulator
MPVPLVRPAIADGRLKVLSLKEHTARQFPIHAVYDRGRAPGKAGRWLIDDLRERVTDCNALPLPTAA